MSSPGTGGTRRRGRPLVWICVIVTTAALAGYLTRPEGRRSVNILRSSLRTTPDGVAALSRAIARLGRHTEPRLTPMMDADPVRGTIVLLQPRAQPSPRESEELLERVRSGGTFLYAPPLDGLPITTPLMLALGVWFPRARLELPDSAEARWADHPLAGGLPSPGPPRFGFESIPWKEVLDSLRAEVEGDSSRTAEEAAAEEDAPETDFSRARTVRDSVNALLLPDWFPDASDAEDPEPLLTVTDSSGSELMAAALWTLGEGRIVIFADARPLSNGSAGDDPLAVLAVRAALAHTSEADTVFFDEFHQGITGYGSRAEVLANFFLGSPGGRTLLHMVLVCFLFLACKGLRFGVPTTAVAPSDRERKSPLEHVSALGNLYRKAGAAKTAALLLLARLAYAVRSPPPRDMEEAASLLKEIEARRGRHASLDRVREGLDAEPVELSIIADGVDQHLARRFNK